MLVIKKRTVLNPKNEFFKKKAKEVIRLIALGKGSAEIAKELNISPETVNTHRKNIKKNLEISTTYQFTQYARAYDLV